MREAPCAAGPAGMTLTHPVACHEDKRHENNDLYP